MISIISLQIIQKVFFILIIDQFMLSESSVSNKDLSRNQMPNDMEKLYSYMKNVLSNPSMMEQMQKFMAQKQAMKNSNYFVKPSDNLSYSRMEPQINNSNYDYIIESQQRQKPQPLKVGNKDNLKKVNNSLNRKKGTDVLANYINNEPEEDNMIEQKNNTRDLKLNKNNKNFKQPNINHFQQAKNTKLENKIEKPNQVNFDDIPIKSNFINNAQTNGNTSQMYASYPEITTNPIKKDSQINNKLQKPLKNSSHQRTKSQSVRNQLDHNNKKNVNQYNQFQQRPITGSKKDFMDLLKQKFDQTPFQTLNNKNSSNQYQSKQQSKFKPLQNQYPEENQQDQQNFKKPKRQFLKRGSRQHLSSAKDRQQIKKKNKDDTKNDIYQENPNTSRINLTKTNDRDKTPQKRDVSQNRVLSKRNTVNNDISVPKIKNSDRMNTSQNQQLNERKVQENPRRSITPKHQRTEQKKSPMLPPKSKNQSNNLPNKQLQSVSDSRNTVSGKKKNVFDDSSSNDQNEDLQDQPQQKRVISNKNHKNSYQPQKQYNLLARQKKQQVIEGVFLTKSQLQTILDKYSSKNSNLKNEGKNSQQKFNELRKKYTDLCNLLQTQKAEHQQNMARQREQFQNYKQQEIQKLKNQKRVMQRQIKSSMPSQSQNLQKDKQQTENLKKQLEKQKQQHKKKQKNNKILIEKYKKENEQLKFRLEKLQESIQKASSKFNYGSENLPNNSQKNNQILNSTSNKNISSDKSKSKLNNPKDISPAKMKASKNYKSNDENQEDENQHNQDKNYKKTVPLYNPSQKDSARSQEIKKKFGSKGSFQENNNSDDQNLPSFKVDNKKQDQNTNPNIKKGQKNTKNPKKYQYVQNSSQISATSTKKSENNGEKIQKKSIYQSKGSSKNAFDDSGSSGEDNKRQAQDQQNWQNENKSKGNSFFKPQPKYQKLQDLMTINFSIKNVTPQLIQSLFRYQNNPEYCKYLQRINNSKRMIVNSSRNAVQKKITNIYNDKSKQVLFQNGVKKQIFEDGYTIIYFKNGDVKQKLADGTTLYHFKEKQVDQITLVSGLNIYRFQNNQVQLHFDQGKYIQIRHPDGTIKTLGSPVN